MYLNNCKTIEELKQQAGEIAVTNEQVNAAMQKLQQKIYLQS